MLRVENIYDPEDASWFELIRPLLAGELDHHARLDAPGPEMFGKRYDAKLDYTEEWPLSSTAFAVFAAFDGENPEPVGFISASVNDPAEYDWQEGYIGDVYADPSYRGHGVGRAMMETVMEWFSSFPKVESIVLEVWKGNDQVIPFYGKWGFQVRNYVLVAENSRHVSGDSNASSFMSETTES